MGWRAAFLFVACLVAWLQEPSGESVVQALRAALESGGVADAREAFREAREHPDDWKIDEGELNALGYELLRAGRIEAAVAVFEMNTEAFPRSANAWDSLGEAYFTNRQLAQALQHYRKALELDPELASAKAMLRSIQGMIADLERETREPARFAPGASTGLDGPWLGQPLPGRTPEVFAAGIVSIHGQNEFAGCFAPDGRTFCFSRRGVDQGRNANTILVCTWEPDGWTAPRPASFSGVHSDYAPLFAPDGVRLLFGSFRPLPGATDPRPEPEIWMVQRDPAGWSEPRHLCSGAYVALAADGTLYVSRPQGVVTAELSGAELGDAQPLVGAVNARRGGGHPWVAPDQRLMLFDAPDDEGTSALFVSFLREDGGWGEAIDLAARLGAPGAKFCPSLSPDGRLLFFAWNLDLYWVGAEVLEGLEAGAAAGR